MDSNSDTSSRWSKLVLPIVVPVVVAILIAGFTPVGTWLQSLLFPSLSTVHGFVKLNGQPVDRADVTLDEKKHFSANADGLFVLGKIREGDHTLTVTALGSRTHKSTFIVKRDDEETDLGVVELVSSLKIGGEGSGRWRTSDDPRAETLTFDVAITLWLDGDDDVLSRVETVTYAMSSRIQPHPVVVSSQANRFCYQLNGSLEIGFGEQVDAPIIATVTFDDGQTLTLTSPPGEKPPSSLRPPGCG